MVPTRKLGNILQELKPLVKQGGAGDFFDDINVDELSGLVGGIHDAAMDYQVCVFRVNSLPSLLTFIPDFITTRQI